MENLIISPTSIKYLRQMTRNKNALKLEKPGWVDQYSRNLQ